MIEKITHSRLFDVESLPPRENWTFILETLRECVTKVSEGGCCPYMALRPLKTNGYRLIIMTRQ